MPVQVLLHVLFEHAAGYALFAVREAEEIGLQLPQVRGLGGGRGVACPGGVVCCAGAGG